MTGFYSISRQNTADYTGHLFLSATSDLAQIQPLEHGENTISHTVLFYLSGKTCSQAQRVVSDWSCVPCKENEITLFALQTFSSSILCSENDPVSVETRQHSPAFTALPAEPLAGHAHFL